LFSYTHWDDPFCPIFFRLFSSTYWEQPSFLMFFYFGEWGLDGIDKMSLCTAFEGVNSSLPLATSRPAERLSPPTAGARFDLTNY
jgi:hypothetical protein